jgi:effector-binding domain-containing protein
MRQSPVTRCLFVSIWLLAGCGSNNRPVTDEQVTQSLSSESRKEPEVTKPFMFNEAKLPLGFPPPSPTGQVVIKDYPAYRLARIRALDAGRQAGPNTMFGPLFNHIKRNDIAMTAPVEMTYPRAAPAADGDSLPSDAARRAESMAFLYRDPSLGAAGPDQADPRVVVDDVPAMTVLSVAVRGGYTEANFTAGLDKLRAWLEANPQRAHVVGPPRYLAYNSPFVPGFLKIGEVQLPVERDAEAR